MSNANHYSHSVFATARHADLYAKFRPILPKIVLDYVLDYLKLHIEPNEWHIAVDVGCGGGQSTQVLAKYFKNVYGFDVSAAQINEALEAYHPHNVHYQVSIAENIPCIESNSVQLLIACVAVQWFDLSKFFVEANRMLAPNGMVALIGHTMFEPIDPDNPDDHTLTQLMLSLRYDPSIAPYKLPNTESIDKRYKNIVFPDYFEYTYKDNIINGVVISAQDILGFLETWSPYQQMYQSSQSEAKTFLTTFEQKLKNILKTDDLSGKKLLCNYRYYIAMEFQCRIVSTIKTTLALNMSAPKEIPSVERYNWLFHMHYVRAEYDQCLNQIQRFNTHSEYAVYLTGLIRLREGDAKSALMAFDSIKTINNPTYIKAISRCLTLLGRHQNVCDLIKEVGLKVTPNDWQLWCLFGNALLYMGNIQPAKDAFQNALQTTNQIEPFISLAQCHIAESDYKSAIFVLRRATELSPNDSQLTIKLGILLINNGMTARGVEKILQVQNQTNPSDLSVALAIGSVLQDIKVDIDSALYRYKATNVFESPSLWNNIALCFAVKKKFVAAVSCLKRALYLNPIDWRINFNLGLINLQLRQYASAFHFLKNAVANSSATNPTILSLLGICLECLEDEQNARQAHTSASKSSNGWNAIPVLNYAVFLYNEDSNANRDTIIELLMEFEQCWLKRSQTTHEFDGNVMKVATNLANALSVSSHMAWVKEATQTTRVETNTEINVGASTSAPE
ncbi:unnamed protein product [Oppiella nova]|uniref:Methyltransferase type 11 domain-containing protein n=1 Tax=Oppiella nova TaxID=334625 RepID=A0A7R9LX30_9ACAR|nr:unnamed protein product [Oppiella nova]CAG2167499.1 unnamed protein product [Oppiella nova]